MDGENRLWEFELFVVQRLVAKTRQEISRQVWDVELTKQSGRIL